MSEQEQVEQIEQQEELTPQQADPNTAADSGENHENKITFSEEQQKVVNDIAAKKAFEAREAKREAEELRKQLEEAKSKIPQQARPSIPEVDPYSDTYEEDLRKRDEAVKQVAAYERTQAELAEQDQARQQEEQRKQEEVLAQTIAGYNERAVKLGVSESELRAAGNAVVNYGIDPQVASFILSDDNGPLITKYLSMNPLELESLNKLDPMNAAIRIQSEIKQKASALGIKTPKAPPPVDQLNGSGMPLKERGPKGATYT